MGEAGEGGQLSSSEFCRPHYVVYFLGLLFMFLLVHCIISFIHHPDAILERALENVKPVIAITSLRKSATVYQVCDFFFLCVCVCVFVREPIASCE